MNMETPLTTFDVDGCDATFTRVCPTCGKFVEADEEAWFNGNGQPAKTPNATCKKCGRVQMEFEGYF